MPSFEEEAFERARKMTHNRRPNSAPHREEPHTEEKPKPAPPEPPKPEAPPKPKPVAVPAAPNMMETLFKNKENSLIMMLLLLLMDEKNDPSLIFSLMYLLL